MPSAGLGGGAGPQYRHTHARLSRPLARECTTWRRRPGSAPPLIAVARILSRRFFAPAVGVAGRWRGSMRRRRATWRAATAAAIARRAAAARRASAAAAAAIARRRAAAAAAAPRAAVAWRRWATIPLVAPILLPIVAPVVTPIVTPVVAPAANSAVALRRRRRRLLPRTLGRLLCRCRLRRLGGGWLRHGRLLCWRLRRRDGRRLRLRRRLLLCRLLLLLLLLLLRRRVLRPLLLLVLQQLLLLLVLLPLLRTRCVRGGLLRDRNCGHRRRCHGGWCWGSRLALDGGGPTRSLLAEHLPDVVQLLLRLRGRDCRRPRPRALLRYGVVVVGVAAGGVLERLPRSVRRGGRSSRSTLRSSRRYGSDTCGHIPSGHTSALVDDPAVGLKDLQLAERLAALRAS